MPVLATQIKSELDRERTEAATAWAAFDELRKAAVESGHDLSKPEHFDKLDEAHKSYATHAEAARGLEERYVRVLEMDGDGGLPTSGGPLDGGKSALDLESLFKSAWEDPIQKALDGDAYKALQAQLKGDGGGAAKIESRPIEVFSKAQARALLKSPEFKTLLTELGATGPGLFLRPDRQPGMVALPRRQRVMTNLVTVGTTDSDAVDWVQMTSRTNAAAETTEATTLADAAANAPESGFAFQVVQSNVQEIKHYIPATRRAVADVGELRTIIDQELGDGVLERLDGQLLNGNGTAPNLRGILNTSGILVQAKGADTRPDALHKALTQVLLNFWQYDAIVMHPQDWENIRLQKNANGDYQFGPPNLAGDAGIWGVPVTLSLALAQGTALVGAFARGATLWIREGVSIVATDSHSDWFIRGIICVLAYFRAAFAVQRPTAFCSVTGL